MDSADFSANQRSELLHVTNFTVNLLLYYLKLKMDTYHSDQGVCGLVFGLISNVIIYIYCMLYVVLNTVLYRCFSISYILMTRSAIRLSVCSVV